MLYVDGEKVTPTEKKNKNKNNKQSVCLEDNQLHLNWLLLYTPGKHLKTIEIRGEVSVLELPIEPSLPALLDCWETLKEFEYVQFENRHRI